MFEKISKNENLLHHNEVGAIIQCKDCNRIAIIIQSILYTCDEEEYDYFFELIIMLFRHPKDILKSFPNEPIITTPIAEE